MDWTFYLGGLIVFYLLSSIRVLRQYERGVVFTLGKFTGIRQPGLTMIFIPFQQMVRVSLRTVTMQIPSQKIITRDNVSIDIAAVAYYRVVDPEKSVIQVENVENATNQISQTTVRNVVGQFSLDELLSQTPKINEQIWMESPDGPDQPQTAPPSGECFHAPQLVHSRVVDKQGAGSCPDEQRQSRRRIAGMESLNHRAHEDRIADVGETDDQNPRGNAECGMRNAEWKRRLLHCSELCIPNSALRIPYANSF